MSIKVTKNGNEPQYLFLFQNGRENGGKEEEEARNSLPYPSPSDDGPFQFLLSFFCK